MAFRLRKSKGGSTLRGGETIRSIPGDRDLVGSGDASGDASAHLGTPIDLAGSGHASGDASAILGVPQALSGSGHAASDALAFLGTPVDLSGDGHAAGDATADMGDFSFMVSSGHASGLGLATQLNINLNVTLSVTLPVMQFTALLDYILNPGLVGGTIRPTSAVYAPFSAVGGTASGSPGGQQGDYVPSIADPSLYQPLVMWRKHLMIPGVTPARTVLVPYIQILENQ